MRPDAGSLARRAGARRLLAIVALPLLAVAGCKLEKIAVPTAEPQIVVHCVLDPFLNDGVALVEQSLTGEVSVPDRAATDSLDPIVTGGGIPIRDATIIVRDLDTGGEVTGTEDALTRPDGKGKGVYRFPTFTREFAVRRGGRYELEVRWRGLTARSRTTVPNPSEFYPQQIGTRTYNVDHDSLVLDWYESDARRFVLQAETPYGPFRLFSGRQTLVVRGALRNLFVEDLPPVFIPGFLEVVTTAAVDTNYFDYYRSASNPFTGAGLLNHVEGGVGVFGSVVRLDTRRLDVTADMNDLPIEGHFVGGPSGADALDLYLGEELGGGARRVSGALWIDAYPAPYRHGLLGVTTGGGALSLAVLRGSYADDTLTTASGTAAGDSVVLAGTGGARGVYRRVAAAAPAHTVADRPRGARRTELYRNAAAATTSRVDPSP